MKFLASIGILLLCPLGLALAQEPQQPPSPAPAPPPPPAAQSTYEETESLWSVTAFYWLADGSHKLRGGKLSPDPGLQSLDLAGNPKNVPGIIIGIPTGHSNRLELTVFESKTAGTTAAPANNVFFGTAFDKGDVLTTETRVRNAKLTWNYLTYPYPALDTRLRVKTLWGVQYTEVRSVITAPNTAVPATATADATPATQSLGKRSIIFPSLGLGVELIPSRKHFRVEAEASGFAFPHRSVIWDAQANAILRLGPIEISAGGKAFHYKSSPNNDEYLLGTLWGPVGSVRWVFR